MMSVSILAGNWIAGYGNNTQGNIHKRKDTKIEIIITIPRYENKNKCIDG